MRSRSGLLHRRRGAGDALRCLRGPFFGQSIHRAALANAPLLSSLSGAAAPSNSPARAHFRYSARQSNSGSFDRACTKKSTISDVRVTNAQYWFFEERLF